jgi:hypothetical protein
MELYRYESPLSPNYAKTHMSVGISWERTKRANLDMLESATLVRRRLALVVSVKSPSLRLTCAGAVNICETVRSTR